LSVTVRVALSIATTCAATSTVRATAALPGSLPATAPPATSGFWASAGNAVEANQCGQNNEGLLHGLLAFFACWGMPSRRRASTLRG